MAFFNLRPLYAAVLFGTAFLVSPRLANSAEIAITIDDFDFQETAVFDAKEKNRRLLSALEEANHLKAAAFVVGKNVTTDSGKAFLREWDQAGHLIGNHTFSHRSYNASQESFESFSNDALLAESALEGFKHFRKFFRFPMLHEGNSFEKRDKMRSWLSKNGYRNGHVTIDASDWYIDERLRKRLQAEPSADTHPYRDYYLKHIWSRAQFYDELATKVLGRKIKHTLLLHYNALNALYLKDVIALFQNHGWQLIDARESFQDPLFAKSPSIVPAGQSLIWALAKETGKFETVLRYPGEDGVYEREAMDQLGL